MLLIFLSPAFLGRELGARGAPVNGQLSSTTLIPGISESIEAGCPDIGNLRSGWDILWSCLATIFACTWIALHPNIQARKDGWYKVALRRLKICFYALMAPEMILSWALRQWLGARHISRKYQSRGWTLSHGFFVQMGGFMLVEGEKPARTLTYEEFEALYESGKIEFPTISENEIQDRSKSDMISKSLVVIQTSWFILQTVTRIIQHLPIAELELITLSFALLNGVMYFLWWRKPLDVRCPIMLYLNPTPHPSTERGRQLDPTQVLGAFLETRTDFRALTSTGQPHLLSRFSSSSLNAYVAFTSTTSGFIDLNPPVCLFADTIAQGVTWILFAIFMLCLAVPYAFLLICKDFLDSLSELSGINDLSCHAVDVGALEEVSPFYAAALPTRRNRYTVYFFTAMAGLGFAGIHYFSWKLPFSSDGDKMLWMACIYFTIYCTLCYLSFALMLASGFLSLITYSGPIVDLWPTSSTSNLLQFCLAMLSWSVVLIAGIVYVPARSVLFITAFSMLSQLPENAYRTVPWTSLIPHMH